VFLNGVLVQPPQQENATSISTELEARKNTPVNIGQISKDLGNKDKEIGISTGFSYENTTGSDVAEWSLVIR
jgi:hypothetical protein